MIKIHRYRLQVLSFVSLFLLVQLGGGGGGGRKANVSLTCILIKTLSFCQFLLAFMTMKHTDIDYDGKYVVALELLAGQ